MVAGDLAANRSTFTTRSGRTVALAAWANATDIHRTEHAMASLKAAMAWDEENYGREYDLDEFNLVAVDDFNFGAMERSEEHTSELQSLMRISYAVFCLKKKKHTSELLPQTSTYHRVNSEQVNKAYPHRHPTHHTP